MGKNDALLKLKSDIKAGNIKGIYIFTGDETYLKEKYIKDITALIPDGGFADFNHIKLEGNSVATDEYDNAWESFPMMTDSCIFTADAAAPSAPPDWMQKIPVN